MKIFDPSPSSRTQSRHTGLNSPRRSILMLLSDPISLFGYCKYTITTLGASRGIYNNFIARAISKPSQTAFIKTAHFISYCLPGFITKIKSS